MGVDIRLPIGGMFAILGAVLVVYGVMTNGSAMYARSLDYNVNIWWGLVQFVFGATMLFFASRKKAKPVDSSAGPQDCDRPARHG